MSSTISHIKSIPPPCVSFGCILDLENWNFFLKGYLTLTILQNAAVLECALRLEYINIGKQKNASISSKFVFKVDLCSDL